MPLELGAAIVGYPVGEFGPILADVDKYKLTLAAVEEWLGAPIVACVESSIDAVEV